MESQQSRQSRFVPTLAAIALTAASLVVVSVVAAPAASAAPGPIANTTAANVSASALPTAQMDGVAWAQVVDPRGTVWVAGKFANARPAGFAAGVNTSVRNNLMAYDVSTGVMKDFGATGGVNPNLNAQAKAVALSPDGTKLYVGGQFTTVNGVTRNRIAEFNATTGALIASFAPYLDYTVNSIAVTNNAVYVGGSFAKAGNSARAGLAAFVPDTGALLAWAPTTGIDPSTTNKNSSVNAIQMTPDGKKVVVAGSFGMLNGMPTGGIGAVDAASGATISPWHTTDTVSDSGDNAAFLSLTSDGTKIYGTGYVFGAGGNIEGTFAINPADGTVVWVEDCHGDSYGTFATNGFVYTVSHAHYCGNIGGFPQTSPTWTFHRAMAFTAQVTGTINHDPYGYHDFFGTPSPSIVNWFPELAVGNVTGKSQAAWTVSGNSQYVVLGGEFPTVNGTPQQGLVRFSVRSQTNLGVPPALKGALFKPSLLNTTSGAVRVSFQSNWDQDDSTLNYEVYKNGNMTTPVYKTTANSTFWNMPTLGFFDNDVTPGVSVSYRLAAIDAAGNKVLGDGVSITPTAPMAPNPYATRVKADGASPYLPFNETSGTVAFDGASFNDADITGTVTRGVVGPVAGDTATAFDGSTASAATRTAVQGPDTFTAQAWINTGTGAGGKILGFGASQTGLSNHYDRQIYMDNAGHIIFGVYSNGVATLTTTATYNDSKWHQITASLGPDGMKLSVDGAQVGARADVTAGEPYSGYWRVGGDNLGGWNSQPSSNYFAGSIGEVAVYPTILSRQTVDAQWVAAGNASTIQAAPADAYGAAVYNDNPTLYWRLGETSGTTAADASSYGTQTGAYAGGVTQGTVGAVKGTSNTAATFDGASGQVNSNVSYSNPTVYSEELWFKTTTTSGGKLIGFGSNQTGQSSSYDRHVYMQDDGRLVFGAYTGQLNTATTPNPYNDGKWHYMVATQGSDGMKLYVDNTLTDTNPDTAAQSYDGYWKVGGDTTWGSSSAYFAGSIDEVAVYPVVLSPGQINSHYVAGNPNTPANVAPTAAFTSTSSGLTGSFDASTSKDSDGTIAGYAWNFGDGSTGTGVTPSHTYAAGGTYTVTLTVTDNGGLTGTVGNSVAVAAANVAPTAAFTSSSSGLTGSFDGSASKDSDGTIAGYAWNFGDGSTGTGVTPSHTYAAGGTYTVTLTVTDNGGLTGTVGNSVAVAAANVAPTAAFTSSSSGLTGSFDGSASKDSDGTIAGYAWNFGDGSTGTGVTPSHTYAAGGTYTVTLTVTDNGGLTNSVPNSVVITAPNVAPTAAFTSSSSGLTGSFDASTSKDSDGTIAGYAWNFGDGSTGTGVTPSHTYAAGGTYTVTLTVTDNGGLTNSVPNSVVITAPNVAPTAAFTSSSSGLTGSFDASTSKDSDGTIAGYAWNFGDGSTGTGVTPSHTYAAGGTYTVTLTVTDNGGLTGTVGNSVAVAAANVAPTAAFTSSSSGLTGSFDGSASKDSDGTIAGYAWNFGDGSTGTGVTPSHTYAAGGTYTVTLTVTDNGGLTGTANHPVAVAPPAASPLVNDTFTRTVTSGFGTSDAGGAWTVSGGSANFSVGAGSGKIKLTAAGAGPSASLGTVNSTSTDLTLDMALDKAATGGGTYMTVSVRKVGTSEYRLTTKYLAGGTVQLQLVKVVGTTSTTLKAVTLSGVNIAPGEVDMVRFQVFGTTSVTLQARMWKSGTVEPTTWQVSATDATNPLATVGGLALYPYLSGTSTNAPVTATYDNLKVMAITP